MSSTSNPVGATGAILAVRLTHELERLQKRLGMVTMCHEGGTGIPAIFESYAR